MKYNWYNLIGDLKTTLLVANNEPSVNASEYNNIVSKLSWYGLPQDLSRLIKLINHSSVIIEDKVSWFKVREKAEEIFNNFN